MANTIGSRAEIAQEDTVLDNRNIYVENDYSYAPLPLDWEFYDFEREEFRGLDENQMFPIDGSIVWALKQLVESPFLLMEMGPTGFYIHEGEIKNRYEDDFDEEEAYHFYRTTVAVKEHPELIDELWDLAQEESVFWIATLADVNKRKVREALYPLIAELESRFSSEVKGSDFDTDDLIPELRPDTVGRWKQAQLQGINLHIAEQMSLSELARIIEKDAALREEFGFESRNQFNNSVGGLIELRNQVMHPTRPLIWNKDDLINLVERIDRAESIIEAHGGRIIRDSYD
jgi:hypothetical protein